ncbi:hypothetical protein B0H12DRAFT_1080168 [Mycena haematopus]|nr:hypothetical protein B0H12DRAFT_1080168 [Mycena haematopus]
MASRQTMSFTMHTSSFSADAGATGHQNDANQLPALTLAAWRKCRNWSQCKGQIDPVYRFVKCAECRRKDRIHEEGLRARKRSRASETPMDSGTVERIRAQESEISRLRFDLYQMQVERIEMVGLESQRETAEYIRSLQSEISRMQPETRSFSGRFRVPNSYTQDGGDSEDLPPPYEGGPSSSAQPRVTNRLNPSHEAEAIFFMPSWLARRFRIGLTRCRGWE